VTLTLRNKAGRLQVFVLAHETYCATRGECACDARPGRDARRIPRSLTLATGLTLAGLDDAVLAVPEVRRAVQRGELGVERVVARHEPTDGAPTSAAESSGLFQPKKKRGSR